MNAVVPHAELLVSTAEDDQAGVGTRTALDLIAEHEGWRKEASRAAAFSQRDLPMTRLFQTGWLAQWREMIEDPEQKIARPRQVFTGAERRDYVPMEQR